MPAGIDTLLPADLRDALPALGAGLVQRAVKPALTVSLHTSRADLRAQLLPCAPCLSPEQLMEQAETCARAARRGQRLRPTARSVLFAGQSFGKRNADGR